MKTPPLLIRIPVAAAIVTLVAWVLIFHRDAPVKKVARVFTTEGHRCLICNESATTTFKPNALSEFIHYFCPRHSPPDELSYWIWPEVDKYLFLSSSLLGGVMGIGFGVKSTFDHEEEWGEYLLTVGGAAFLGLVCWFLTFSAFPFW